MQIRTTSILLLLITFIAIPNTSNAHTEDQATEGLTPVVFLVEGNEDCCMYLATDLIVALIDLNVEFAGLTARHLPGRQPKDYSTILWENYTIPWNGLYHENDNGEFSEQRFLDEVKNYVDDRLEPGTPLIFIGHSFGGDSIVKLLDTKLDGSQYNVLFAGVIDPVDFGGQRSSLKFQRIPSNVEYFFNRWQTNGHEWNGIWLPLPLDFILDGEIPCDATSCSNQREQSVYRHRDGSAARVQCGELEFGCDKADWEWVDCGIACSYPRWFPGYKNKPIYHSPLAYDLYVQKQMIDIIRELVESNKNGDFDGDANPLALYVDKNAAGLETGSSSDPFNTVTEAVSRVHSYGIVYIRPASYDETITINTPVELRSTGGMVTIGSKR